MDLFEECKEALSSNFMILDEEESYCSLILLDKFFNNKNVFMYVDWSNVEYIDYINLTELMLSLRNYNTDVYVVTDNDDIPIFKSKLKLVLQNFYDVACLSTKVFIFNKEKLLFPLFPSEIIRIVNR